MLKVIVVPVLIIITGHIQAQNDLLSSLKSEAPADRGYTTSTFKSTRVINSHSVETISKGNLDFRISHRFGRINSGSYNFFGLDQATIRLALEYGLFDRVNIGIGRSSFEKTFDGFVKIKLLRQRHNDQGSFPVTVTWFSNTAITSLRNRDSLIDVDQSHRYSFAHQLIIARKFNSRLSWQIAPIFIHQNLADIGNQPNDSFAVETGGRVKISKRVSINFDYIYRLPNYQNPLYTNSLSVGVDIETGGHVFQLHCTNSQGMIEEMFVNHTTGTWSNGDIFYGFNISRQFNLIRKK